MYTTREEITASTQSTIERSSVLANAALSSAERYTTLNLETARTFLEEAMASAKVLLNAKDAQELVSQQTALLQPATERAAAYSRSVHEIAAQNSKEIFAMIEAQIADVRESISTHLDKTIQNAQAEEVEITDADAEANSARASKAVSAPRAKRASA